MKAIRRLAGATRRLTCWSLWVSLLLAFNVFAQGVLAPRAEKVPRDTLALAASAVGARQCLAAISSVSTLAVQGASNNDVLFDWDHKRMGAGPVFSLLGLSYPGGGAALTVAAVPEADGTCSVAAERISFEATSCKQVVRRELRNYRAIPLVEHMTVYTNSADAGSSISLIESPPGCIVIRRYVKFTASAGGAEK